MGLNSPANVFLTGLGELVEAQEALLIFEAVMTGAHIVMVRTPEPVGKDLDLTTLSEVVLCSSPDNTVPFFWRHLCLPTCWSPWEASFA
jgi:hypothetical protein